MKFRRFLSGFLFGAGCALTFIGVLAVVLPSMSNRQLKTVLASFAAPSDNTAVTAINRFMTFTLSNGWSVALLGLLTAVAGGFLLYCFQPRRSSKKTRPSSAAPARPRNAPDRSRAVRVPAAPVDREAPNPFAAASYQTQRQEQSRPASPIAFHAAPMLERNKIEETPADSPVEAEPTFAPRSKY